MLLERGDEVVLVDELVELVRVGVPDVVLEPLE